MSARARRSWFGDVVMLGFLCVQACDGVLTYVGVATFGSGIEGNPLLASLMVRVGEGTALLGAKVAAGVFGIALHLSGVHRIIALLTLLYLTAAVIPWTALLFFQ